MPTQYEKQIDTLFKAIGTKLGNAPRIIEIGARDCRETLGFLAYAPEASITTFECNPDTLPLCRDRVASHSSIMLVEKAVSDTDGEITFNKIDTTATSTPHRDGNPGASSLLESNPAYDAEKYVQTKIIVPTTRLDTYLETQGDTRIIDLIWMDVQGAELQVLRGAGVFLDRVRFIHTEVEFFPVYKGQALYGAIKKFLDEKGFVPYRSTSVGRIAGDMLFARKENTILIRAWLVDRWFRMRHALKRRFHKRAVVRGLRAIPLIGIITSVVYQGIRTVSQLLHSEQYRAYQAQIQRIVQEKKIVLSIPYGGIGDWLAYSALPGLLVAQYGIECWIEERSYKQLRNKDTYRLFFERNPLVKGIARSNDPFTFQYFAQEKKLSHFVLDQGAPSIIEMLEQQFAVSGNGVPVLPYTPTFIAGYEQVILVDKNYISGKAVGWKYSERSFEREIARYTNEHAHVVYVDPTTQNLETYINMIYSCKHFITVLSGGAAIAACFDAPFTVVLPYNVYGESVDQFVFKESRGVYVR